jgi:cytochrome b6-f complex iron-sulfur subunit
MSDLIGPTDDDAPAQLDATPDPMGRRRFLVWAAGASLGASAIFIGATVIQAMVPPSRSGDGRTHPGKVPVAKLAQLKLNEPQLAEYGQDMVFVLKTSGSTVVVFDAACPHVRCALRFNGSLREFECPCHSGAFALDGSWLRGPASRDMILADSQIVDGDVVVSGFRA